VPRERFVAVRREGERVAVGIGNHVTSHVKR
jgi:hypothetical protein